MSLVVHQRVALGQIRQGVGGENTPQREPRRQSRRRLRELDGVNFGVHNFAFDMEIHHHPPTLWPKRQWEQTHKKANCVIFHNSALARRCAHEYLGRCVMNMHPGPPQHAQIDELLVGGNDKEGANLDTARWRERPSPVDGYGDGGRMHNLPLSPPARRGGKTHLKRRVWNTVKRNKPKQAKPSRGGCVKLHFCYSQGAATARCSVCFSSVPPGGATTRVSQSLLSVHGCA